MCRIDLVTVLFISRLDLYNEERITYQDIRYEQACVLYNIGSLYSQLSARENRLSDEVSFCFL